LLLASAAGAAVARRTGPQDAAAVVPRLAGLDVPAVATAEETQARSLVAADIYCALPDDERATISTEMGANLGPLWFGHPREPDEDAATPPVHTATLASTLTERGDMAIMAEQARRESAVHEPVEAAFARRGLTRRLRPAPGRASSRLQSSIRSQEPMPPSVLPDQGGFQHRL